MNKLSRLTALLLVLMMLLGSLATAEGGLPIGGASGLTSDDWASLVDQAEEDLFFIDEGATGQEVTPESPELPQKPDYYPYTDIDEVTLVQSDASAEAAITASGAAILTCAEAGQWQISVDGVWANLPGETGTTLTVNSAMMNGQSAEIRKALGEKNAETGEYAAYTQTAVINIVDNIPAMFSVSRDAEGTGDTSDANDGVMTLELANQDNMVVVQVIYCIKDSKLPVAEPYIGQIAKGSTLNTMLTLPRVVGYLADSCTVEPLALADVAAFTEQTATNAGSLTINVTEEQSVEDITIYVEYVPTEVSFVVKHFQQNVDNDGYTEVATETKTGLTGAPVGEGLAKTYEGFSAIWYDPTTAIAADGSTVVEIYYNREYYLMTFDLGGGYGVEPIFARFGATVSVDEPERTGYAFKGWSLDGTNKADLPSAIPAENRKYTALWEAADTTYTVVYWRADVEDGDDTTPTTYSYWGYETVNSTSGTVLTPSAVGKQYPAADVEMIVKDNEAGYFTYDEAATVAKNAKTPTVVVAGDGTTVVNVYYSRNEYEIRYIYARESGKTKHIATLTNDGTLSNCQWTDVDRIPDVTDDRFTSQTEKIGGYTYYFISIEAEYGVDVEGIWPAAAIGDTKNGDTTYNWGSWAAEAGTGYRRKYGDSHANIVGAYPVMSADMIKDADESVAQRMIAWWGTGASITAHSYHIYHEALPEQAVSESDKTFEGKRYALVSSTEFTCAHNGSTRVDPFEYEGYECVNEDKGSQGNSNNYQNNKACPFDDPDTVNKHEGCDYCNVFYYDRVKYTLSFYNHNNASAKPAEKTLMFGESFTDYKPDDPEYPVGAEPGSLKFVGWYTTPEAFEGTEVDWANGTMPAGDLTFYAKWALVTHDVHFWLDKEAAEAEDNAKLVKGYPDITHGMTVGDAYSSEDDYIDPEEFLEKHQEYKDYTFDGWYFIDEDGAEMRFDIDTMPIKRDLDIYAKWTSNEPVEFVFHYTHNSEDGEKVADSYTGQALPGTLVTMSAKIGDELNLVPEEQDPLSYIPQVNSHSITLDVDPTQNVFTFVYVQPAKVKYTVQYLAAKYEEIDGKQVLVPIENAEPLAAERIGETTNAIVTENYVPVLGYMPQATQLRLIVSMDESLNVLQFLYVESEKEVLYDVSHVILESDEEPFTWRKLSNLRGNFGETMSVDMVDITGYKFSYAKVAVPTLIDGEWKDVLHDPTVTDTQVQYELPKAGMHVYLYYERDSFPYIVYHLDAADDSQREEPTTDTALYGSTLTTSNFVKKIEGYRVSSMTPAEIKVDVEAGTTPVKNVMYIYYEPDVADITISKEVRVSPEDDAPRPSQEELATAFVFTVTLKDEEGKVLTTADVTLPDKERKPETLPNGVLTFTLQNGQTMTIHDLPVGTKYVIQETETNKFKTSYSTESTGTLTMLDVDMIVTNMYPKYAGELTIKKDGLQDDKESAIVKATVGGVDYYLVLNKSNGYTATISGIKPGTSYNVTEVDAWTWQYKSEISGGSGTLTETKPTATVTITNTSKADKWLHDESHVENNFGTDESTGVNQ